MRGDNWLDAVGQRCNDYIRLWPVDIEDALIIHEQHTKLTLRMVMCRHNMSVWLQSCNSRLSVVLITLAKQNFASMYTHCNAQQKSLTNANLNSTIDNLSYNLQSTRKLLL